MIQHKARILLAEDDITNQQATLAVLANLGIGADAVGNGQEAITALETTSYDLVLMDCQMPVLNGYEATKLIRNGSTKARDHLVPVIALTASTILTEHARCMACGMNDFLAKPVRPQTLTAILAKWLPQDSAWNRPSVPPAPPGQPGQEPTDIAPIWDQRGMLARLLGDEVVAQKLLAGFLVDIPLQVQALATSLLQGDILATMRQAHSIKGAAAIIGGQRLQAAAMAMERSAAKEDIPALHARLETLRLELAMLQQTIQQTPLMQGEAAPHDHGTSSSPSL